MPHFQLPHPWSQFYVLFEVGSHHCCFYFSTSNPLAASSPLESLLSSIPELSSLDLLLLAPIIYWLSHLLLHLLKLFVLELHVHSHVSLISGLVTDIFVCKGNIDYCFLLIVFITWQLLISSCYLPMICPSPPSTSDALCPSLGWSSNVVNIPLKLANHGWYLGLVMLHIFHLLKCLS